MAFDVKKAAREVKVGEPFVFDWCGEEFTVPSREDADYEALVNLDRGFYVPAFQTLLGEAEWARLVKLERPKGRDLVALATGYFEHLGASKGE